VFTTPLILEADPRPDFWIVYAPLVWSDAAFGELIVPVGFPTDLASVPRFLWTVPELDPDGLSRYGAVAHDWLYMWQGWPKAWADNFLRAALLAAGASQMVADWFYDAVKDFGQSSWDNDIGALATRGFDTPAHYEAWLAVNPGHHPTT
jgi:hypothetical protein